MTPSSGAHAHPQKITRTQAAHRAAVHQHAATWAAQTYRIALAALSSSAPLLRRARRDAATLKALEDAVQQMRELEQHLMAELAEVQAAQVRVQHIVWGV